MEDKALKKLSRRELLEMLLAQSKEMKRLQAQLDEANEQLEKREIAISQAGSIAEAALQLNEVFEKAQKAADQYLMNVILQSNRTSGDDSEGGKY